MVTTCLATGTRDSCVERQQSAHACSLPLTPRLLEAAHILLHWGEFIDCLVGERQEAAWLEGAATHRSMSQVRIRTWFDGEWTRTVALSDVFLPGDVAQRLEAVAAEVGR